MRALALIAVTANALLQGSHHVIAHPAAAKGSLRSASSHDDTTTLEDENYWDRLLQQTGEGSLTLPPTMAPPTTLLPTQAPVTAPTMQPTTSFCTDILWSDEFNTGPSLNESYWSVAQGGGGFGNLELQTYTNNPANVRVENGTLIITALEETTADGELTFTSGRIRTEHKVEVLYGTVEARIKIPDLANGLWPAFWTLGGNFRQVGWPSTGEIDIMEMGSAASIEEGVVNRRVTSAAHWENVGSLAQFFGAFTVDENLNNGEFHMFRMEWTPTRITTYVNDNEIWRFDIGPDVCTDCREFHQPHFLLLNLAVGGTFTGILDEAGITASFPAEYVVDYVRVCDNGDTVVSGNAFEDPVEYTFDCGAPDTCTTDALNNYAGEFKCGDRIRFLIESSGLSEEDACRQVAGKEFPTFCGVCIPQVINCDFPEMCTDTVLDNDADGFSCRDRIAFLVGTYGETEQAACKTVAAVEFPAQCGGCNKIDCGMPEICTDQALDSDTGGIPCRDRVRFLIGTGVSELEACRRVAGVEFSETDCGPCNPPLDCGVPETCTDEVLNANADGFSCRDRILFVIGTGLSEKEACRQIAGVEFPQACGNCNPPASLDCGLPGVCTDTILDMDAGGFTCRERIEFLIGTGLSVEQSCNQVGGVEFQAECGACSQGLDCGVPDSCTGSILDTAAGDFTCRDRITFLIGTGLSEEEACRQIGSIEFPVECGACAPPAASLDCGLPDTCTDSILDTDAGGFTCRERIEFLISTGLVQDLACRRISRDEFPMQCGACNTPLTCGLPDDAACTDSILEMDADGFTCGERIEFLMGTGLSEEDACRQIGGIEFPGACGACNPP